MPSWEEPIAVSRVIRIQQKGRTNGSMASRSLILLLLRLRCDNMRQSWRAPRPLLILLSLSSNRLSFGNLGKPLSVVRPTLIKLSDSKLTYSSLRPSICVARALSRFNSSIWKGEKKSCNFIIAICLHSAFHIFYIFCRHIITLHFHTTVPSSPSKSDAPLTHLTGPSTRAHPLRSGRPRGVKPVSFGGFRPSAICDSFIN